MDFDSRCFLINRIISGYKIVTYSKKLYYVFDPRSDTKYIADIYCKDVYDDLVEDGFLNEEESLRILNEKGLWCDSHQNELKILQKDETTLKRKLTELRFRSIEKRLANELLEKNRKRQKELMGLKNSLLMNTAEYFSKIEKFKKLLFHNCFYENGKRVWKDWDEFDNKLYEKTISYILKETYLKDEMTEGELRELARTEPWRSSWRTASKTGNLFACPISEMTDYQRHLCSWSLLYDGVYESMDCPDEETINNDDLLDIWLEDQHQKRNKDNQKSELITNNSKIASAQEVCVVVDTPEDAEKVYKLNSGQGMNIIKQREDLLSKKGRIKETELPDVKQDLIMQLNNQAIAETKKRG